MDLERVTLALPARGRCEIAAPASMVALALKAPAPRSVPAPERADTMPLPAVDMVSDRGSGRRPRAAAIGEKGNMEGAGENGVVNREGWYLKRLLSLQARSGFSRQNSKTSPSLVPKAMFVLCEAFL